MSNEELLVAIRGIVEETLEKKLEEKLEETLEKKFEEKLTPMNQRLDKMDQRLDKMDQRMDKMEQRMDKMEQRMDKMEQRMDKMEQEITTLRLDNENVIKPQLRLLAENYVPAAKKYEKSVDEIEQIKRDVDVLKNVVAKHSETLQKIS